MKKNKTIWLFFTVALALPFLAFGIMEWYQKKFNRLPVYGVIQKEGNGNKRDHRIPEFSFISQDNEPAGTEKWAGNIVIADFFFTRCPSICPQMTNNMKKVQEAFKDDEEIILWSFTVDPEGDNPDRLKKFSEKFGIDNSKWTLVTGDKKELYRLARNGFMMVAAEGDGGPHDFIHSEKLVLVDKQRRIRGYYDGTNEKEVEHLIKDIKKLKHEK
jgi:protein SCO1/2